METYKNPKQGGATAVTIAKPVIPKIIGDTNGEVKPVLNMHQRKAEMARQADAFIALPGLLNVDGYYNSLLSFIDKAVDEGFVTLDARRIIVSAQTAHELLSKLEVYEPEPEPENGTGVKSSWETEQQLGYSAKSEIAR
ncbi:hypothetical protein L1987_46277 [Smallanthus sonchifolius]|uniref:Uncharacterized protein n=1 Tax=Smallanthus sonchifolius TaxID=185202 RepID=A0ACB9FZ41_9ASTR|nr:hypothetical protein L1987_46277 [Smallanthus sonchifolius]